MNYSKMFTYCMVVGARRTNSVLTMILICMLLPVKASIVPLFTSSILLHGSMPFHHDSIPFTTIANEGFKK